MYAETNWSAGQGRSLFHHHEETASHPFRQLFLSMLLLMMAENATGLTLQETDGLQATDSATVCLIAQPVARLTD